MAPAARRQDRSPDLCIGREPMPDSVVSHAVVVGEDGVGIGAFAPGTQNLQRRKRRLIARDVNLVEGLWRRRGRGRRGSNSLCSGLYWFCLVIAVRQ